MCGTEQSRVVGDFNSDPFKPQETERGHADTPPIADLMRQKSSWTSWLFSSGEMAMVATSDPLLEKSNILKLFDGLSTVEGNLGVVKLESTSRMSFHQSYDILILGFATNSKILTSGVDSDYKSLVGGKVFKDGEFAPGEKSFLGDGIDSTKDTIDVLA